MICAYCGLNHLGDHTSCKGCGAPLTKRSKLVKIALPPPIFALLVETLDVRRYASKELTRAQDFNGLSFYWHGTTYHFTVAHD